LRFLSQGRLDSASLHTRHRLESDAAIGRSSILSGVLEYTREAKRLGILHQFDRVVCADDVGVGRTEPDLDLFLTALNQLQVGREAAIILEDSPNGVHVANRAGVYVVAVPNPVTSLLAFKGANRIRKSLSDLPLITLLDTVQ